MLRTFAGIGAALLLAGGAARRMLWPGSASAQPKEVEMALIAPLSGPWARQGFLERAGAEMAIADINQAGGIKALGGAKIKLVVADAGDTPEKAKDAPQRLVSQYPDLVAGEGAWLSSFTLAVTEVTERAHLPWLTLSYSDQITSRGFHYVFQSSLPRQRAGGAGVADGRRSGDARRPGPSPRPPRSSRTTPPRR